MHDLNLEFKTVGQAKMLKSEKKLIMLFQDLHVIQTEMYILCMPQRAA